MEMNVDLLGTTYENKRRYAVDFSNEDNLIDALEKNDKERNLESKKTLNQTKDKLNQRSFEDYLKFKELEGSSTFNNQPLKSIMKKGKQVENNNKSVTFSFAYVLN